MHSIFLIIALCAAFLTASPAISAEQAGPSPEKAAASENLEPSSDEKKPVPADQKEGAITASEQENSETAESPDTPESMADEDAPQEKPPVNIAELESLGLFERPAQGSLGSDFYKGSKRSAITELMQSMPVASLDPARQKLIFGTLLTKADASLLENDVQPAPGQDLLTIRLEKLLEAGAYKEAVALYNMLENEPYHPRLARTGVLGMMLTGQKSLACIENAAAKETFNSDDFLIAVSAYCSVSFGGSAAAAGAYDSILSSEDYAFIAPFLKGNATQVVYDPSEFSKKPLLERALLVAEGKIQVPSLSMEQALKIPAQDIQILLRDSTRTAENIVPTAIQGARWGLVSSADLRKIYIAGVATASGETPTTTLSAEERIPALYAAAASAPSGDEQWLKIRQALPLVKKYGIAAFLPFSDMIYQASPTAVTLEELFSIYQILNFSGQSVPAHWLDLARQEVQEDDKKTLKYKILSASFALNPALLSDADHKSEFTALRESVRKNCGQLNNKVIENIDKSIAKDHNPDEAYEKDFCLTFKQDYVMPTKRVWDRLKQASKNHIKGETVLLSTAVLGAAKPEEIYPDLYVDVLAGIKEVGLTGIAHDLALAAVLRDTE